MSYEYLSERLQHIASILTTLETNAFDNLIPELFEHYEISNTFLQLIDEELAYYNLPIKIPNPVVLPKIKDQFQYLKEYNRLNQSISEYRELYLVLAHHRKSHEQNWPIKPIMLLMLPQ